MSSPASGETRPASSAREAALLLLPLLLFGGSFLLPWWSITASTSSGTASFDYTLTGLCIRPANACE
ncbi:MAG TPA: hypothetical protein VGR51_06735, partial [Thermoplasmata archaeon]|nr:hypothetical protein [Thermoplasmata archaeon]